MTLTATGPRRPLASGIVALAVLAALIAALASPARADLEPDAELRVWQSVADPSRHWISARPSADASWRTAEVGMALDASGAWRTGGLTVDARGGGSLELRLWQDPDDAAALHLSARAAGASWREHGTQPIALDEERADGAYRYRDLTVTLEEPRTAPAPPGEPRDALCLPAGLAAEDAFIRIWRAEDPARHWISSRPDGDAAWSTVRVPLAPHGDAGDDAPWNAGKLVIDAGDADFELRLWERDGEIRLSARVAGTTWDEYGTQEVELDESRTIRGTDYAYADRELALTLPAAEPAPPGESLPAWDCPVATPTPTPAPAPFVPSFVSAPATAAPNEAPTADAGPDRYVEAGDAVTLDGSKSDDPDGDNAKLKYAWTRTSGTTGTLADEDEASASFTVPADAAIDDAWEFSLVVTDERGSKSAADAVTVTVAEAALTATGITGTGATLNMAGRSAQWWYKRTEGPADTTCGSVAANTATATLGSLTADTLYGYTAYGASTCADADALTTVHFSTTDYGAGNLDEAATTTTCTIGYSSTANTRCAVAFTTGALSVGYKLKSVAAAFDAKSGSPGSITVAVHAADTTNSSNPAATALVTLTGSDPDAAGIHSYACSGSSCNLTASTTYFVVMSTADTSGSARGYELRTTLSDGETLHPSASGWSIADAGRTKSGTNAWAAAGGGRTPMLHVGADGFPPVLTVSHFTETTVTLNLTGYAGDWYHRGSHSQGWRGCSSPVTAGSSGISSSVLTSLWPKTWYSWAAYSAANCGSGTQITGGVQFSTAGGDEVTTHNRLKDEDGTTLVGSSSTPVWVAFTTGSHASGYTFDYAVLSMVTSGNSRGWLTVALHADSSTNPGQPADTALWTLTRTLSINHNSKLRCGGECSLDPDTQYYLVATAETHATGGHYVWTNTADTGQDSDDGWTLDGASGGSNAPYPQLRLEAVKSISLTASNLASTTAKLTLGGYREAWWYQGNQTGATCTSVAKGTTNVNLASLTASTSYTYKAYNASGCASANELASVTFTTTN